MDELIEIGLQMLTLYPPMVRSLEPRVQVGAFAMDDR
jgi:hypothetical protein